jgi:hypothetical protein
MFVENGRTGRCRYPNGVQQTSPPKTIYLHAVSNSPAVDRPHIVNIKNHKMETLQNLGKQLTSAELKQLKGGSDPCLNAHGGYGGCKTDAACPLDLPICEPF